MIRQPELIYEQDLPDDISADDYGLWYRHSTVIDGVRQGPSLDTIRDFTGATFNPITYEVIATALASMQEARKTLDESLKGALSSALRTMGNESAAQKVLDSGLPVIIWVSADLLKVSRECLLIYAPVCLNPLFTETKMIFAWTI